MVHLLYTESFGSNAKQEVKDLWHIWAIDLLHLLSQNREWIGSRSALYSVKAEVIDFSTLIGYLWVDWEGIHSREGITLDPLPICSQSPLYSEPLIGLDRSHGFRRGFSQISNFW